ncbi:MAG: DUF2442 domain-containing protein [Coriobacteriales bacterium]|jgi:hypothetical protein|nr:DUF2442 domain-containing protein [Coriobacteriales bacterium]
MTTLDKDFWPTVVQALAGDDYVAYAYFNDGTVRSVDMKPFIYEGSVFEPLRDKVLFETSITVLNDTIAWDLSGSRNTRDCLDIDPFTLYESELVTDPLCTAPLYSTEKMWHNLQSGR